MRAPNQQSVVEDAGSLGSLSLLCEGRLGRLGVWKEGKLEWAMCPLYDRNTVFAKGLAPSGPNLGAS